MEGYHVKPQGFDLTENKLSKIYSVQTSMSNRRKNHHSFSNTNLWHGYLKICALKYQKNTK